MTSVCSRPAPLACLVIRKPLRFWPKARNQAKTRQGPSFAQQKFFAPCLKSLVLSKCGGAKEGEGGRPDMGVCAMNSGMAGWPTCFGREFEPKTVGPDEATRAIARMTMGWLHRPSPQVMSIRRLARLHGELPACTSNQRYSQRHPQLLHRIARERQGCLAPLVFTAEAIPARPVLRRPTARFRPGLFRALLAVPHDSLSSLPPR